MEYTIYFRVDMNKEIATGHMMRCLSIADELRNMGGKAVFILADDNACDYLNVRGFDYVVIGTVWNDMDAEIPIMQNLIHDHDIEILVIDSYYATEKYLRSMTEITYTLYIDDLNRTDIFTNAVLNYTIYSKTDIYSSYNKNIKLMIGTSYVPLRKVYSNLQPPVIKEKISNILILSGGGDPYGTVDQCLEVLCVDRDVVIHAVCGRYSKQANDLIDKYKDFNNVKIHDSVDDIEVYMQKADLCISAAGTTLYELCACGTPTLSYVIADNQINNAKVFDEKAIIPFLGDVRCDNIGEHIIEKMAYFKDAAVRKRHSYSMMSIVDGGGSGRVIEELINCR